MVELDRTLFLFINSLHTPLLDGVMDFLSMKAVWIPLYIFIIYLLVKKYRGRVWVALLFTVLLIVVTDQVSVLIKNTVARLRPCHEPALEGMIHLVRNQCGGMYGFVSSHAANTFGIASFTAPLINKKWYSWSIFIWAAMVSYSRIYLGVHYPGDVIFGALLGIITGFGLSESVKQINKGYA